MHKLIADQLKLIRVANLGSYDEINHQYIMKKVNEDFFEENHYYDILLNDVLLDPNYIININWNNGDFPSRNFYRGEVTKVVGKMIKITGVYFDRETNSATQEMWEGWLPTSQIKIIKELPREEKK